MFLKCLLSVERHSSVIKRKNSTAKFYLGGGGVIHVTWGVAGNVYIREGPRGHKQSNRQTGVKLSP